MERELPLFEPSIILCIAAHPDDLEFGTSGSVAKWVAEGAVVHYLVCTDGSKGSDDPNLTSGELIKLRHVEQQAAADILGVTSVTFLDHEDGLTEANTALKRDITAVIRRLKPDTVVMQDPLFMYSAEFGMINHNDHRKVAESAMDAVYPLARDHLSFPELMGQGLEPHKVKEILMMSFEKATFYVDISTTFETKMKALAAHESQVDIETVRPWLEPTSKSLGKLAGYDRAEGFIRLSMRL
ncbi:PIG-L family deacetylase [Candidatus Saccharibacteria bacterium]|nr:PIG-L family deacetylase [Candidatus Saccharibacteria bacterium]